VLARGIVSPHAPPRKRFDPKANALERPWLEGVLEQAHHACEPRPVTTTHEGETQGAGPVGLDERAQAILEFEGEAWKLGIPKHRAIREHLGISPTRYHQLLNRIVDTPEALAADPMLVRRLRRLREARRRRRVADRLGVPL